MAAMAMRMGMEAGAKSDEDCYYFFYSTCQKGSLCPFRHASAALGRETICRDWAGGACAKGSLCPFRHMQLNKARNATPCYWESQPSGCLKPHCVFRHSKQRSFPSGTPGTNNPFRLQNTPATTAATTTEEGRIGAEEDGDGEAEIQVHSVGSSQGQQSQASLKGLILPSVEMMEEEGETKQRRIIIPKKASLGGGRRSAKERLGLRLSPHRPSRSNVRDRLGERKRSWSPAPRSQRKRGVVNQTELIRRHLRTDEEDERDEDGMPSSKRRHSLRRRRMEDDDDDEDDEDAEMLSPPVATDSNDRLSALLRKSSPAPSGGTSGPVKLRRPSVASVVHVASSLKEKAKETRNSADSDYEAAVEALVGADLAEVYREEGIKIHIPTTKK